MNQPQQADFRTLMLEALTDTKILTLLQYYRRLSVNKRRLLLRIARALF